MKKRVPFFVLLIVTIIILVSSTASSSPIAKTDSSFQQSVETDEIIKVVENSYQIEAAAGSDFDTSKFQDVFINDPRGGDLSLSTKEFISSVMQSNFDTSYGYLDYKIAYYTWWKDGALKLEVLLSKIKDEDRMMTEYEMSSLVDRNGRVAMPRLKGEINNITLSFTSIIIDESVATVVFDDGPRTNRLTLVKIDNKWYIAGNTILAVHP